jgi:hypothetical protein
MLWVFGGLLKQKSSCYILILPLEICGISFGGFLLFYPTKKNEAPVVLKGALLGAKRIRPD